MPYVYRVSRSKAASPLAFTPSKAGEVLSVAPAASVDTPADEPSYRELQAAAKEAGIKANQPADELKKALGVGNG